MGEKTSKKPLRLTESVRGAGCASKLPPGDLDRALCGLEFPVDTNVLVGLSITGFIHPGRILTKQVLKSGDRLVLTKPLGTALSTPPSRAIWHLKN